MQYIVVFLEGIITFLSPCLLPMLPIYLSYFAGGGERSMKKTLRGALGFVAGFTIVFMLLGALAGTLGSFLKSHQTIVNIVSGLIVIFFGLHFLGAWELPLFRGGSSRIDPSGRGFFASVLFGIVFSLSWTPCVGAFLGSALMLASQQGHAAEGMGMLLVYSLGLGLPYIFSAILIDSLKTTFDWVKRHYDTINKVSGIFLIVIGLLMAAGMIGQLLAFLA